MKTKQDYLKMILELSDLCQESGGNPEVAIVPAEVWKIIDNIHMITRIDKPTLHITTHPRAPIDSIYVGSSEILKRL